jgi:DNA-directed RNA polymerase subunit M/transcription elongation factor TFIIS
MSNKHIRHIVADQIGDIRYCPNCGSELEVMLDMETDYERKCPECGKQYHQHEIEFLEEKEETEDREELMEQEDTTEVLRSDTVHPDDDIDVLRPDVDLRMERLSYRSVYVAGYDGGDDGDLDYRYWFGVNDEGELRIDREFRRDKDD